MTSRLSLVRRIGNWLLTLALAVVFLIGLSGVVYLAATPYEQTEPNTEFYVLGPDGAAEDYPSNLSVGEKGEFIVGVTNNEHEPMQYTAVVEVEDGGQQFYEETLTLPDGETYEERVEVEFDSAGEYRLNIWLYEGADVGGEPYRKLWLTVNVSEDER